MALFTETCCKQSPIYKKKQPLIVIHGIFLCLYHHYNVINQIKTTSWSLAHLICNTLNNHASSIHVKEFHTVCCLHQRYYHIYSNARQGYFLKFGTQICMVILNSHMKHRTSSFWTGPCGVKPRPPLPNRHMGSASSEITQQESGNSLSTFPANISVPSSRVKNPWEKMAWLNLTGKVKVFKEPQLFGNWLYFCFQAKNYLTWWTPYTVLFSVPGHHSNSNSLWYVPMNRSSP